MRRWALSDVVVGVARATGAAGRPADRPTCSACAHFVDDPAELEALLTGITALSSAFGSSRGDAGVCRGDGTFHDPEPACPDFVARAPAAGGGGACGTPWCDHGAKGAGEEA